MLKYGCTRSQLMKAAWAVYHRALEQGHNWSFSQALRATWIDARYGYFEQWPEKPEPKPVAPMTEIESLKLSILTLDCKDCWQPCDYDNMRNLQAHLSRLQNTGNEQRLAA